MQARDEDGQAMTDEELRDELVTLLLAGHETTATSVAWAIERLVRHPREAGAAGRRRSTPATAGEEYMTAVVNETLRVRPVVPIVARMLHARSCEVGGHTLPAGTRVAPSIYLTNRNPRVYERAGASSARSASSTARRRRSRGSRSAAASAAASARRSRCWR